jgi:hypothetical protein
MGLELSQKTRSPRWPPNHGRIVATRAVTPETATLIERLKRENPYRTVTALLREFAHAGNHYQAGLSAFPLYRFLRARGLTKR